ncbi:hypothetical protein [Pelodictyon luteolum]|nr:hypothetical protein [Pelodictyon luteolum]
MTAPSSHTGHASLPAEAVLPLAGLPLSFDVTPVSGVTLKGSVR